MQTFTEVRNERYHIVSCYTCGNPFGVTDQLYERAVKDKRGGLHCPACGASTRWVGKTDDQKKIIDLERKLKWEAEQLAKQIVKTKSAKDSLSATKGVITKIKKRVHNGVCPCCNRSFVNLNRHMKTKHPDYLNI